MNGPDEHIAIYPLAWSHRQRDLTTSVSNSFVMNIRCRWIQSPPMAAGASLAGTDNRFLDTYSQIEMLIELVRIETLEMSGLTRCEIGGLLAPVRTPKRVDFIEK
jgi:hypothetical protein